MHRTGRKPRRDNRAMERPSQCLSRTEFEMLEFGVYLTTEQAQRLAELEVVKKWEGERNIGSDGNGKSGNGGKRK